jgi:hypothetical protein
MKEANENQVPNLEGMDRHETRRGSGLREQIRRELGVMFSGQTQPIPWVERFETGAPSGRSSRRASDPRGERQVFVIGSPAAEYRAADGSHKEEIVHG